MIVKEKIQFSKLIAPVFFKEHIAIKNNTATYFLNKGGRSSTKSSFISLEVALGLKKDKTAHAAILMKVGEGMEGKVAERMTWAFEQLHLDHEWKLTKKPLRYTNVITGQKIFFSGCDDPNKSKGLNVSKGAIKYIWFEETDQFESWKEIRTVLNSLLRKSDVNSDPKFKVFFSYNPPREPNNWINKFSKEVAHLANWFVLASTYLDVPREWLTDEFLAEAQRVKETDERAYRHEYLGEATGRDGLVYPMFDSKKHVIDKLEPGESISLLVGGVDGGSIIDATTLVPLGLTSHGRIVCLPTMYYSPTELGHRPLADVDQAVLIENHLAMLWGLLGYIPSVVELVVDSAASDIFLQLKEYGNYSCMKVDKKDVMIDMRRVQSLLSYEGAFAIIDRGYYSPFLNTQLGPRDMLIEELESKVINEKTGKPEDGNDHEIDALKYATRRLQLRGVI